MSTLSLRRDPLRLLFSPAPWKSAWYLLSYLVAGSFLCAVVVGATVTAAAASVTIAGLPLLVAAAGVVRWCADVERGRLLPLGGCEGGGYQVPPGPGLLAALRTRWRDPATWRNIGYLAGLWIPLVTLDAIVVTVWLTLLAGITLPAWYWAPWSTVHGVRYHGYQLGYFPNGPHGQGGWGLYVDTLPEALVVAAVCLVLVLLFTYALVGTAKLHAAAARTLLRAPDDPLREAKEVLLHPGPLSAADLEISSTLTK